MGITTPFPSAQLLHPSGGLVWHWRAWRQRRRWDEFRATLARWLADWQPCRPHLLLVGPSAGHTLPMALLARFASITALEPDPLARWLLRRRAGGVRIRFETALDLADARAFARLAHRYPGHAMLFCNVLGQLAPATEDAAARWCGALRDALAGHAWASWHDLVSTATPPRRTAPVLVAGPEPPETTLARFWNGGTLPLVDHGTESLAPDLSRGHVIWPITAGYWHLVEWCAHTPAAEML